MDNALNTTAQEAFQTPPWLFRLLAGERGFDLDAAAFASNALCPLYFGPDHERPGLRDALSVPDWGAAAKRMGFTGEDGELCVWNNPPYRREGTGAWIEKAWREVQAGHVESVTILVNANMAVNAIHDIVLPFATEILFVRGRVSFTDPVTGKPQDGGRHASIVARLALGRGVPVLGSIHMPRMKHGAVVKPAWIQYHGHGSAA